MKEKLIDIVKNFSYSMSSNLISMLISTLVVLVVPRIIGVEDYGFWQLYLFYSSYMGFLHFGWNDGIYLRYGGEEYEDLDKPLFFSQFYSLFLLQVVFALILVFVSFNFINDVDRLFILQMLAIEIIVVNTRHMLAFILQATNRIKDYAKVTIFDRIFYASLLLILLLFGVKNYRLLVTADLTGKIVSLFLAMYLTRDIVFRKITDFKNVIDEIIANISTGIKLMFSNIANMLITGVIRFGIEQNWSVAVFGQISLTLSVSNMFLLFINALGMVIYPILRRINTNSLTRVYSIMRDLLMAVVIGMLILYMPIKSILSQWLPQYAESLNYMALLFPIIIYESKMSLLINTYMKALRYENILLKINIVTMILSFILTYLSTSMFNNLDFAILSIVMLMAFRGVVSEIFLSSTLKVTVMKDIILELLMTVIFIYTAWVINSWITPVIYGAFYVVYMVIKRKDLKESVGYVVGILRS